MLAFSNRAPTLPHAYPARIAPSHPLALAIIWALPLTFIYLLSLFNLTNLLIRTSIKAYTLTLNTDSFSFTMNIIRTCLIFLFNDMTRMEFWTEGFAITPTFNVAVSLALALRWRRTSIEAFWVIKFLFKTEICITGDIFELWRHFTQGLLTWRTARGTINRFLFLLIVLRFRFIVCLLIRRRLVRSLRSNGVLIWCILVRNLYSGPIRTPFTTCWGSKHWLINIILDFLLLNIFIFICAIFLWLLCISSLLERLVLLLLLIWIDFNIVRYAFFLFLVLLLYVVIVILVPLFEALLPYVVIVVVLSCLLLLLLLLLLPLLVILILWFRI